MAFRRALLCSGGIIPRVTIVDGNCIHPTWLNTLLSVYDGTLSPYMSLWMGHFSKCTFYDVTTHELSRAPSCTVECLPEISPSGMNYDPTAATSLTDHCISSVVDRKNKGHAGNPPEGYKTRGGCSFSWMVVVDYLIRPTYHAKQPQTDLTTH